MKEINRKMDILQSFHGRFLKKAKYLNILTEVKKKTKQKNCINKSTNTKKSLFKKTISLLIVYSKFTITLRTNKSLLQTFS